MSRQRWWRKLLSHGLLAAGLASGSGCLGFLHPIDPPGKELCESCHELPKAGRGHVYVFLVNGLDLLNCANLSGVCDYLHTLGFTKTYYGQCFLNFWYNSEIRQLHKEDPEARFVLIGYSYGANMVRSLAQDLKAEGVTIDLLVYLDRLNLDNSLASCPDNVNRVINVVVDGTLHNGEHLEGVDNFELGPCSLCASPTRQATLEMLAKELTAVAARVPIQAPPELPPAQDVEMAPTPRPVKPQNSARRDEWDFLKPSNTLGHWPPETRPRTAPEAETSPKKKKESVGAVPPTAGLPDVKQVVK